MKYLSRFVLVLLLYFFVDGCSPKISPFSERAYLQATSLKAAAVMLMNKATDPYQDHAGEIREFKLELNQAYEYAKGRPDNEISARQWQLLISPERNLLGGFLRRWEEENSLGMVFIREVRDSLIIPAFDLIIELESAKIKPEDANLIGD